MCTLGPILWDFAKHTMAFKRNSKRVLWHGTDATAGLTMVALTSSGPELLDALLAEFADLFAEPQGAASSPPPQPPHPPQAGSWPSGGAPLPLRPCPEGRT